MEVKKRKQKKTKVTPWHKLLNEQQQSLTHWCGRWPQHRTCRRTSWHPGSSGQWWGRATDAGHCCVKTGPSSPQWRHGRPGTHILWRCEDRRDQTRWPRPGGKHRYTWHRYSWYRCVIWLSLDFSWENQVLLSLFLNHDYYQHLHKHSYSPNLIIISNQWLSCLILSPK